MFRHTAEACNIKITTAYRISCHCHSTLESRTSLCIVVRSLGPIGWFGNSIFGVSTCHLPRRVVQYGGAHSKIIQSICCHLVKAMQMLRMVFCLTAKRISSVTGEHCAKPITVAKSVVVRGEPPSFTHFLTLHHPSETLAVATCLKDLQSDDPDIKVPKNHAHKTTRSTSLPFAFQHVQMMHSGISYYTL